LKQLFELEHEGVNPMKTMKTSILATIVFGLIGGLFLAPLTAGLGCVVSVSAAFCLSIWIYLASYSVLLIYGCGKNMTSAVFPLLLALLSIFWSDSVPANLIIAAGTFSWIRSGICYPDRFTKRFLAEIVLCAGAALIAGSFAPLTVFNRAIAVWMFFLIQALYFVIFEDSAGVQHGPNHDPFESARQKAETILSAGL
jgi:hypothetical protein